MKKVVSFSIYGNVPCYQVGAIMNIVEVARLLPDWKCRFYTTDSCTFCNQLEYLGAEVVRMNNWPKGNMFWRFLAVDDTDICIIRDADSVVNERERECMKEWLKSDYQWHIMRDNPAHTGVPILGGMWGYRRIEHDDFPNRIDFRKRTMSDYIAEWRLGNNCSTAHYGKDQTFLKWLYENFIKKHSDIFRHGHQGHPFPKHPQTRYATFVGCSVFKGRNWNPNAKRLNSKPPLEVK
jgi:hypothetical protein